MTEMPDLPNWLQWLIAGITIITTILAVGRFFWKRWLGDWLARWSEETAKNRAKILIRELDYAWQVVNHDRQFQAHSFMSLSNLVMSMLAFFGSYGLFWFSQFMSGSGTIEAEYFVLFIASIILLLTGLFLAGKGIETRQRYIFPFLNWQAYFDSMTVRIDDLLIEGGLTDEAAKSAFVDEIANLSYNDITDTSADTDVDQGGSDEQT